MHRGQTLEDISPMKYTTPAFLSLLALLLLALSGCLPVDAQGSGNNSTIPYINKQGIILIQLFNEPGFIYPPINAIPTWTLYGDGTLIIRSSTDNLLRQTRLSTHEVQQILDVVVRQDNFFSSTRSSYGEAEPDLGPTLLTVNAQSQRKTVNLQHEPAAGQLVDSETQHVFAIENYLLHYQPKQVQPYVPTGVALLALPSSSRNEPLVWPYNDISLAKVAAQECGYLPQQTTCTQQTSGMFPVYGKRGLDMLTRWPASRPASLEQNNVDYTIIVWPLLPDALVKQPDGSLGIFITSTHDGREPLVSGPGSGTP
jgi:hypothetical protein